MSTLLYAVVFAYGLAGIIMSWFYLCKTPYFTKGKRNIIFAAGGFLLGLVLALFGKFELSAVLLFLAGLSTFPFTSIFSIIVECSIKDRLEKSQPIPNWLRGCFLYSSFLIRITRLEYTGPTTINLMNIDNKTEKIYRLFTDDFTRNQKPGTYNNWIIDGVQTSLAIFKKKLMSLIDPLDPDPVKTISMMTGLKPCMAKKIVDMGVIDKGPINRVVINKNTRAVALGFLPVPICEMAKWLLNNHIAITRACYVLVALFTAQICGIEHWFNLTLIGLGAYFLTVGEPGEISHSPKAQYGIGILTEIHVEHLDNFILGTKIDDSTPEYITHVATVWEEIDDPQNSYIAYTPCKARHCNLMHFGSRAMGLRSILFTNRQGFVTSHGRFVEREEAFTIAFSNNGLIEEELYQFKRLFSETLF